LPFSHVFAVVAPDEDALGVYLKHEEVLLHGEDHPSMVKTYSRPGNMPHSAGEILQPKAYICIGRVALVGMSSGVLSVAARIV
jgi:hypothetical protein